MQVLHEKFGEGKVISIEGSGANKIAGIRFWRLWCKENYAQVCEVEDIDRRL